MASEKSIENRPFSLTRLSINHFHLGTLDLDIAQNFYQQHFGYFVVGNIPGKQKIMRLMRNPQNFLLVFELQSEQQFLPDWFHLGFEVGTKDELASAYQHFVVSKVEIIEPLKNSPSYASFMLVDPDGYRIQLFWSRR